MSRLEPSELPLIVSTPAEGIVRVRNELYTTYRPAGVGDVSQLPVVVFVHGAFDRTRPVRPRDWAMYDGRLAAGHGLFGIVVDLPHLHWPLESDTLPQSRRDLDAALSRTRELSQVASDRIALWAFSAGALLSVRYIAQQPSWLRCAALSYPLVFEPGDPPRWPYLGIRPRCPMAVIRVGQEDPTWLAELDSYLTTSDAEDVDVISVPHGHHGFDALDDSAESRDAITATMTFVARQLA